MALACDQAGSLRLPEPRGMFERMDRLASTATATFFGAAIGIVGLAVPLLAVAVGYSAGEIGVLVALGAVSQMAARLFMGMMMRVFADKSFVWSAGLLAAVGCGFLVWTTDPWIFVLAQLFQGVARAFFWTGSQTHAVRAEGSSVAALSRLNVASGVGQFIGPALAGALFEVSPKLPLLVGGCLAVCAAVPAFLMQRLPPFEKQAREGRTALFRYGSVRDGCWAAASAGSWRALVNSYIPVLLHQVGQSGSMIGIMVSGTNAASLVGSVISNKAEKVLGRTWCLALATFCAGLGIAALGVLAPMAAAAALTLIVAGLGAGILQTVGPAVTTVDVPAARQGDAIAASGTVRAAALFSTPFGIAGLITIVPLTSTIVLAGCAIAAPAARAVFGRHHPSR